jgi:hypothetical protein
MLVILLSFRLLHARGFKILFFTITVFLPTAFTIDHGSHLDIKDKLSARQAKIFGFLYFATGRRLASKAG